MDRSRLQVLVFFWLNFQLHEIPKNAKKIGHQAVFKKYAKSQLVVYCFEVIHLH